MSTEAVNEARAVGSASITDHMHECMDPFLIIDMENKYEVSTIKNE